MMSFQPTADLQNGMIISWQSAIGDSEIGTKYDAVNRIYSNPSY